MKSRSLSKVKRILAFVMVAILTVGAIHLVLPAQKAEAAVTDAPATEKTLIDNGDGTYTLALSVTGEAASSTISQVTKANVILVVDTSNSMNGSSGTTAPYVYTEYSGSGQGGGQYWGGPDENGDYYRVYWRNNNWRETNSNWGTVYTGTVYTRSGGGAVSRIEAEKDALTKDSGIVDNLLAQNVPGDANKSDIIEVAVVNFGTRGTTAQTFTTNGTTLKNTINGLTTSTGTNWEEGLMRAKELADGIKSSQPNEDVYIIFLTDGEPTTHNNDYTVNTNYAQEWAQANDDARGIVTAGYKFYALFTWGSGNSSHYLSSLVQYAYTGAGNSNSTLQPAYQQYFTDATDTETLIEALNQIVHDITQSVGYTNVEMTDGVTEMTTSSVKTTAGGEVTGLKYYRSGGSYGTGNGGLGTEWTDAPKATINADGEVDWNLGSIVLEDGVTYTVTFVVWPSQESLDLVADLNNGIIDYDDLEDDQKAQISVSGGHYSLKTNTDYPTITYSTVTTTTVDGETTTVVSDPITTTITNPDPVGLAETKMNAKKIWEDSLDPSQREEIGSSVELFLKVDGEDYYVDAAGKPIGVTLLEEKNWTETDYIAIAPGIMVDEDSPAYDATAPQVEWEGKTYAIIEPGHEYVFEESETNVHFELTAYTHHPMIMGSDADGKPIIKDVIFTKSGNTITGIEAVFDMEDALSATNTLKGGINITKKVVDGTGKEIDSTDPFTVTVTMTDPNGGTLPTKTAEGGIQYTIDYRIYYGENNPLYGTVEGNRSNHIYKTGTTFDETIYVGDTIRVVNVEDGTIYTVAETAPKGYEFVGVDYTIAYAGNNPKADPDHTVHGNSASNAVVTNKYTYGDLQVSKTVSVTSGDEAQAKAKEFVFTFKLYEDNTKAKELTGLKYDYTITDAEGSTTTGSITEGGTFKLKDGEKIVIEKLPAGSYYEVSETAETGYVTTKTGDTGTIVKDETAEAAFTNTYSVESVIVDPPVKKDITGNEELYNKGDFTFTIASKSAPEGVTAPLPENTSITNSEDFEKPTKPGYYEFGEIEFTAPGTYVYTVTESGSAPGVTNDEEATKELTFVVEDNGEGALTVTPGEDSAVFNFTNVYKSGELDITKTVENTANPQDNTKFTFTVTFEDAEGETIEGSFPYAIGEATSTVASGGTLQLANGETAVITGIPEGVTYTVTEAAVTGYTTTEKTGDTGTISSTQAQVAEFTNTYSASGEIVLEVEKKIEGAEWPAGKTLTFTLSGQGGTLPNPATKTIQAAGKVTFDAITYTTADAGQTYTYTISEDGFGKGWTGDGPITVEVKVVDKGDGTLEATPTYSATVITNTYKASGTAVLEVEKAIEGAEWPEGKTLTFTLDGEGGTLPSAKEKTLSAPGTVSFDAITYTEADINKAYTYTISEDGFGGSWTSSGDVEATVTVSDNGDGTLATKIEYKSGNKIINTFDAEGEETLTISKVLEGAAWPEGKTLTFTLTGDGPMPEQTEVILQSAGAVMFGPIALTPEDLNKTYTYTISEDGFGDGWTGSGDVTVTMTVKDAGNGELKGEISYTNDAKIINTFKKTPPPIKTGDYFRKTPFIIAMTVSGLAAIAAATLLIVRKKRAREEKM